MVHTIRAGGRPPRPETPTRRPPTRKPPLPDDPLLAPVQAIRGAGPRLAEGLARFGVRTVEDLVFWPPRAYRDRRRRVPLAALQPGLYQVTEGRVASARLSGPRWRRRLRVTLHEGPEIGGAELDLVWFRAYPGQAERFAADTAVQVAGVPGAYEGRLQIVHPEIIAVGGEAEGEPVETPLPVYPEVSGFDGKRLRRVIDAALERVRGRLEDPLPAALRAERGLCSAEEAARRLHHPAEWLGPEEEPEAVAERRDGPWRRLAYGEAFALGVAVARGRQLEAQRPAPAVSVEDDLFASLRGSLGFTPTGAQDRAFAAVRAELASVRPMRRLLQGDVGSGKTAVAMLAAAVAVRAGRQAALLAPTEILADQHAERLRAAFGALGIKVARLTGALSRRERSAVLHPLALGVPQIVVGTHALLEDPVALPRLALAVVDEQQRFGVHQRYLLSRVKTEASGVTPHLLVMTATPIPRTLALALYGDLDALRIDELPPGRVPPRTETLPRERRAEAYAELRRRVEAGERVFVICPLVEPSEDSPLPSAAGVFAELSAQLPPGSAALLHGRLLPEEKLAAIGRFRRGEARVLVSTSVVEVGVDVPEATGVLVDGADRFGLSPLHQIRGRVGRAGGPAWCLLLRATDSEAAATRCELLCRTHDGFELAEADLALRGAGDLFGARQSGAASFRFADPLRDAATVAEAITDARRVVDGLVPLAEGEPERLSAAVARFSRSWGRAYDEGAG